jgi:hypothetical protein
MFLYFFQTNPVSSAIVIFVLLFAAFNMWRPSFAYEKDGSHRGFGIGTKRKTILPVWLSAIILALVSYLFVMALGTWY